MVEGSILRLFTFRAVRPAFDEILRHQLVPDLSAQAGILDCYSGRQGPDEIGPRVVASVWVSEAAMLEALGPGSARGRSIRTCSRRPPTASWKCSRSASRPATTARHTRRRRSFGRCAAGWVRAASPSTSRTSRKASTPTSGPGIGPVALYVAQTAADGFITMSAWRDWSDVEHATGGDIHQPRSTRHREHLLDWDVAHYEIVQSASGAATAKGPRGAAAR